MPSDGLFCKGLSFHRLEYVSRDFIESSRDVKLSKKPKWRFLGLVQLSVQKVRSVQLTVGEVVVSFVVKDTASPENTSHASLYAACEPPQYSKSIAREVRSILLPLIEAYTSIDSVFPGTGDDVGQSASEDEPPEHC